MPRYFILDDAGEPLEVDDAVTWARWFPASERLVQRDDVGDGVRVSTIFIGLDDTLWETMILGGAHDGALVRSPTRDAARVEHRRQVARARRYLAGSRSSWEAGD